VSSTDTQSDWLDAEPFRRDGLLRRIGPFAVVERDQRRVNRVAVES
jgi:hypothetical protein